MRYLVGFALLFASVLPAGPLTAQDTRSPLTVRASFSEGAVVERDVAITLTFNRVVDRPSERVAVFIDRSDVTSLFEARGSDRLEYRRGLILLPRGSHELVVYRIEAPTGTWTEMARIGFRTVGFLGFQPGGKADPSITGAVTFRTTDGASPDPDAAPEAPSNLDLQLRLSTEHVRRNLTISSELALVGATRQNRALRFRQLEDEAPQVDLNSYRFEVAQGPVRLSIGHLSSGNQRHLVNRFSSRGIGLALDAGERLDLAFAAQSGNDIVGWGRLVGLDESENRIYSGSVGLEAFRTPGALRVEVTGMQGSILPETGFNQGAVNDAEKSRGAGVRISASGLSRRLRMEGGFAASEFRNPEDPTLAQDQELVEVREETSTSRYLEASLDAVRALSLGGSRTARLTLGYKHERIDPLYRSIAAYTSADRKKDHFDLRADLAGLTVQGNYAENRNNLDDVVSILTTKTERKSVNVGFPVARVFQTRSKWLPSLSWRWDHTHQFGLNDPEDGGFSPSHIPDQVSVNKTARADWNAGKVSFGYEWSRSDQDNRQEGREDADLEVTKNGVRTRFAPWRVFQFNVDLAHESSFNLQRDEKTATMRWGAGMTWQVFDRSSLNVRFSDTTTEDDLDTLRRGNRQFDARWSSFLPYLDPVQGNYFLRFNRAENDLFNARFDQDDSRSLWWLDLGLDFTFF